MTIENYLRTKGYLRFQDEKIRENAFTAVETFLKNYAPEKKNQLRAIPPVINVSGLAGLKKLIINQMNKNTNKDAEQNINAFWNFLNTNILVEPAPDNSLRQTVINELKTHNLFIESPLSQDKVEQRKIRKTNNHILETALERTLLVYFEHFISHYFYLVKQGAAS